jgi:hypothetical protein
MAFWDPTRKSLRYRRSMLRKQLVHAAGCKFTDHGCRCMVVERFNYDTDWPDLAVELRVRVPREMREKFRQMKRVARKERLVTFWRRDRAT